MPAPIPIVVKKTCCEMRSQGYTNREIYEKYFKQQFEVPQTFVSFSASMRKWARKTFPNETTLDAGTYAGFCAHDATVQVSGSGEIVQAWIKQKATDLDPEEFISIIRESVVPYELKPIHCENSKGMLEIPLFDMHWGIAFMDYYDKVLDAILSIMLRNRWEKIIIPFGQDFFHNDSIAIGQTTKGTPIEKVDMMRAVKEGQQFVYAIIDAAINCADEVKVLYSAGNHDRSTSWMFMQTLLERYGPEIVDETLEYRKVVTYGDNSIMITHGDSKRATPSNLAHIFPISFPVEFAQAKIREVHAGHLHAESNTDVFGVMVRRLASGNKTDDWSDMEDFIGTHKRFMLFSWTREKLEAIYYV